MKLQNKKEVDLHLRLSQSEYDKLRFVADSIGWSVSRLIRAYTEKFCGGFKNDNKD
ncbi:MAG: hypothetical protein SOY02_06585 [Candidatus Onthovivens sp.]|nr:hypothetical protein [Candidatus Onthovivens sp.]